MAVKFDSLVEGDELLDVRSIAAGNTRMRRTGVWVVTVLSIDRVRDDG